MPSAPQIIVEIPTTKKGLDPRGSADTATLQAAFPASPIYKKELDDDERRDYYQKNILDGVNTKNIMFGTFNPNFVDAPDYSDVRTGGGGDPASPWVPNPVSPGAGTVNPTKQGDPPPDFGVEPNDTPYMGDGSKLSPKTASELISGQTLGKLIQPNENGSSSYKVG